MRLLLVVAVFVAGIAANSATASDVKLRELFKSRGSGSSEAHIQLRSVLAWVRRSDRGSATARVPVTIILTLKSYEDVPRVCKLSPRLNDALVVSWSKNPLTLGYLFRPEKVSEKIYQFDKTPEQHAVDRRLVQAINAVVDGEPVSDILVMMGARTLGGAVLQRPGLR